MTEIIPRHGKKTFPSDFDRGGEGLLPPIQASGRFASPGMLHNALGIILAALFLIAMAQSFVHVEKDGRWVFEFRHESSLKT